MKNKVILKSVVLIFLITIMSSCGSVNYLNKLTLVDDPFEFQNPYLPINIGNQWTYEIRVVNIMGNLATAGILEFEVLDYIYVDYFLGDSLVYGPLFRLAGETLDITGKKVNKEEGFIIKTNQGIIHLAKMPKDSILTDFRFIPHSSEYMDLFPRLHSASVVKQDSPDSASLLELVRTQESIAERIYYKKNVGLYKMSTESYDQNSFKTTIHNEYLLKDYIVK